MADGRKPFNERKWKRRIGSLPAMWLRDALNLPAPKKGEKLKDKSKGKGKHQCQALIWKAVEEVLRNTRRALGNGSTLSIVDEMFKQTSDQIAFWALEPPRRLTEHTNNSCASALKEVTFASCRSTPRGIVPE